MPHPTFYTVNVEILDIICISVLPYRQCVWPVISRLVVRRLGGILLQEVPFRVSVARQGRRLAVSVEGELDCASSSRLDEKLKDELKDADVELVLDFSEVTFMDSEGIRTLIRAYRRVNDAGGTMSVIGCNTPISRLFAIVGLTGMMNVQSAPRKP